jgi:hypothetical protein
MRSILPRLLLATTLLPSSTTGRGGSGARLTGRVEDPGSGPFPGVSLTLISVDGVLQTKTSEDGSFAFDNLPPGAYQLEAAAHACYSEKLSVELRDNATPVPLVIRLRICWSPEDRDCRFPVTYGPLGSTNSRVAGVIQFTGAGTPIAQVTIQRIGDSHPPIRCHSDRTGRFTSHFVCEDGPWHVRSKNRKTGILACGNEEIDKAPWT